MEVELGPVERFEPAGRQPSPDPTPSPQPQEPAERTAAPMPTRKPAPVPTRTPAELATVEVQERAAAPSPRYLPDPSPDVPLVLPGPARPAASGNPKLAGLLRQARAYPSGPGWREVAELAVELEDYATATTAYSEEAAIYRHSGDVQAAIVEEGKAAEFATELKLYRTVAAPTGAKLERLEPASGCYVGAFIDRDSNLRQQVMASQRYGDVDQFNELTGKKHASFFMYRSYGEPFPTKWGEYLKQRGAIINIAWEPDNIDLVTADQSYLDRFVADAARLDHPVILRFASEMNGAWTSYNGDPEAYKKAFRAVHQATRKAPKVALLWCPNAVPVKDIDDYYPGDEYVDWVGVNFYSVPFLDNDVNRSGQRIHPTEHLKYVYEKYSKRKPIAIGEWAASQQSSASEENFLGFGTTKMAQLYSSLPTRFPRVKLVYWYDKDNITAEAKADRRLNNYQLTSPPEMLEQYRRSVASDYFIDSQRVSPDFAYKELKGTPKLGARDVVRVFLKSYDPELTVYFKADGALIHASKNPSDWYLTGAQLKRLKEPKVTVLVYDSRSRFVTREEFEVEF